MRTLIRALWLLLILISCLCPSLSALAAGTDEEDVHWEPTPDSDKAKSKSKGVKDVGEQVANRIDRIIKKHTFRLWGDPWTVQGIPLIFPSYGSGFNLGLHVAFQDIERQDPHKVEVEAQILGSDLGRYKHFLKVDFPHAIDGMFRITARAAYDRDISLPYFGIGNDTSEDKSQLYTTPLYSNTRQGPSFNFEILRYFGKYFRMGPTFGLKWNLIGVPANSLLQSDNPIGTAGGRTHYIGLAAVYNTTDFEPYPSRGSSHEIYLNWYDPAIGSDYKFFRATYTYRKYIWLARRLIFAHRTLVEALSGDVPFYELGAVGGASATLDFGGNRFLRGYDSNRFIDRWKMALGFELRWDPVQFTFAKQDIMIGFVPFLDLGRVWSQYPNALATLHASTGWGTRIIWNNRFIMRGDYALTAEGSAFYVELGNSF